MHCHELFVTDRRRGNHDLHLKPLVGGRNTSDSKERNVIKNKTIFTKRIYNMI